MKGLSEQRDTKLRLGTFRQSIFEAQGSIMVQPLTFGILGKVGTCEKKPASVVRGLSARGPI